LSAERELVLPREQHPEHLARRGGNVQNNAATRQQERLSLREGSSSPFETASTLRSAFQAAEKFVCRTGPGASDFAQDAVTV
jgi:hypothetical protein